MDPGSRRPFVPTSHVQHMWGHVCNVPARHGHVANVPPRTRGPPPELAQRELACRNLRVDALENGPTAVIRARSASEARPNATSGRCGTGFLGLQSGRPVEADLAAAGAAGEAAAEACCPELAAGETAADAAHVAAGEAAAEAANGATGGRTQR